jgi:phage gp36-like protein
VATVYATPADVLARYGETLYAIGGFHVDDQGALEPDDLAALESALTSAGSEIDLALRARYRLPLASVPPVLARIAIDIAVADLPRNGTGEADLYERRAKAARALLASLAEGETTLDLPAAAGGLAAGGVAFHAPASEMAEKMKDFAL